MKEALFLSGIGTDIGKSYATAWLLNHIARSGKKVITQKFIQTGCNGESIDINMHRSLNRMKKTEADLNLTTAPIILSYPASPHLAALIDKKPIDLSLAEAATKRLLEVYDYDTVIIEGAGGIMVPINEDYLTIDYIAQHQLPLAFVTHGNLGSISDTLLALEAIRSRKIDLRYVIYNPYFDHDKIIAEDAREYMRRKVNTMFPTAEYLIMDDNYTS